MTRIAGLLLLSVLLALVSTGCDEVKVHHDKTVDFSAYQTFAWPAVDPDDKRVLERDFPEAAERITAAVNRELTDRGLSAATKEEADLLVSFHVALDVERAGRQTDPTLTGEATGVPLLSTGDGGGPVAYQDPIKKGTLIFNVEDRDTLKRVWQGQFSRKFRNPSDLEPADIRKAIKRLFRDFPVQG